MVEMTELATRFRNAWAGLSPEARGRIEPLVQASHDQLLDFLHERTLQPNPNAARELVFAQSVLNFNQDSILSRVNEIAKTIVDPNGEIWGPGKFQRLDRGWLEAGVIWLEYLVSGKKHDFPSNSPPVMKVEKPLSVALAGDWGTGDWGTNSNPAASTRVRKSIAKLHPDLTIHLGDVYYAGTETNEEKFLVELWPGGSIGSFALNSNHEMYPGAFPYFREALGGSRFAEQKQHSFFAIETEKWIIVGLDSAYESSIWNLYRDGVIESSAQINFLRTQVAKNKKIIVLTHHNPLSLDGVQQNKLWKQVTDSFPPGSSPAYWYWGHLHAGIVYKSHVPTDIRCRCVGHGALPWGCASSLKTSPRVEWFEKGSAGDPDDLDRVLNGFALLTIEGSRLTEAFYDENGRKSWPLPQS
jgi:hypothetical protein